MQALIKFNKGLMKMPFHCNAIDQHDDYGWFDPPDGVHPFIRGGSFCRGSDAHFSLDASRGNYTRRFLWDLGSGFIGFKRGDFVH